MSSSSSDANLILYLANISAEINRSMAIFIFIFGSIGNILNCLVLSQHKLRSNPCAFLFLISSIANLISILIGVPTRILAGWNLDPTSTMTWYCKCRAFTVFTSRTMAYWLIALATIDRWLSASIHAHYRRQSTLKNAKRGIAVVIFFSTSLYIQMLYCYEANLTDTPLRCYGRTRACRFITDLSYAFITILLSLLIMLIFGLMTIFNVRRSHRRIQPRQPVVVVWSINQATKRNLNTQQQRKKLDHHLLFMLSIEILFTAILTLPQAIDKLYSTLTTDLVKSDYQNAIDSLIYDIVLLLSFLASGMPFYIYSLAGGIVYRKTLRDLLKNIYGKLTCVVYH